MVISITQHYCDRADSENVFDELKNQWGWSGFTPQDLKRCRFMSRAVALIYNWWNLLVRLAEPDKHLEAITSRPLLLHAVGKQTSHAGQTRITAVFRIMHQWWLWRTATCGCQCELSKAPSKLVLKINPIWDPI
ncbi:hypothetical protein BH10PSE19_BH10PSE19_15620 [soil metagenome]